MHRKRTMQAIAVAAAVASLGAAGAAIAAATEAPRNRSLPSISGRAAEGQTLTANEGRWDGTAPIEFTYQWRRCNSAGNGCNNISGANDRIYTVNSRDIGSTLRVVVTATNRDGAGSALSNQTAVVTRAPVAAPSLQREPGIAGTARDGQTLTASVGAWNGTQPIQYSFRWRRCDANAGACVNTSVTSQTYRLSAADVGRRMRVVVTATNSAGSAAALSNATAVVEGTGPAGAIRLPTGETSIPVTSVTSPHRLIVSAVQFVPNPVRSRNAFVARFRVTDTRGYVVRDSLVYALGLPYGWTRNAAETPSGADGWAQLTIVPTAKMPRRGALVLFVRARKAGDDLLAGVSTRRLVQVRIVP